MGLSERDERVEEDEPRLAWMRGLGGLALREAAFGSPFSIIFIFVIF